MPRWTHCGEMELIFGTGCASAFTAAGSATAAAQRINEKANRKKRLMLAPEFANTQLNPQPPRAATLWLQSIDAYAALALQSIIGIAADAQSNSRKTVAA